ncbi:MAG: phosphate ABC transporter permease PstA [Actinobacteria bacterium]|nr:phosphate ABC transporter permease PstA [Actinomycetota bacterium]
MLRDTTRRSRRVRNRLASIWMVGSLLIAVIPLALVIGYVLVKGIGQLTPDWFTKDLPAVTRKAGGGMGPAIMGTLLITLAAAAMAVPLGVLGAIYLHEYGGSGRVARLIRFMADVMTGVPSIVMGLFVYTVWTLSHGLSAFGGALALACLMLPIIIRTTEEMLRLVPDELRQASYALGNRKWRTVVSVVLPAAFGGITSGVMLAIARAAGETAPLVFTIGAARKLNLDIFDGPTTALSVQIFGNAQTPYEAAQARAWGAALTLVAIVFILTILARVISARVARRHNA